MTSTTLRHPQQYHISLNLPLSEIEPCNEPFESSSIDDELVRLVHHVTLGCFLGLKNFKKPQ